MSRTKPIKGNGEQPRAIGNMLVALMFISIGVATAIGSELLDAGVWFALGAALAVLGSEATPWAQIPLWRRVLGGVLASAGVAMLVARLWIDFSN